MLDAYQLVLLLTAIGIALLLAELALPTHGVLGVIGGILITWALVVCTHKNPWAGVAMLVCIIGATPIAWTFFVKFWPRSPMGRKLVLPEIDKAPQALAVRVGQIGIAISELRPMGMCEFDGTRIESISEHGIVPAGANVKVIALVNQRPVIRVA